MKIVHILKFAVVSASIALSWQVRAESILEEQPTNWRLQNYISDGIAIYYTGVPCQDGKLEFGSNATPVDKDRLWSLVLWAKSTGKRVGVFYNQDNGVCRISSFYTLP